MMFKYDFFCSWTILGILFDCLALIRVCNGVIFSWVSYSDISPRYIWNYPQSLLRSLPPNGNRNIEWRRHGCRLLEIPLVKIIWWSCEWFCVPSLYAWWWYFCFNEEWCLRGLWTYAKERGNRRMKIVMQFGKLVKRNSRENKDIKG